MKVEKKHLIELSDGNKYVVVSEIIYNKNKYLYLIDFKNYENIKFCLKKIDNEQIKLVEVIDEQLIMNLIPLFVTDTADILKAISEATEQN